MTDATSLRAWHPSVPGVREVLHARMTDHAYPAHAHADWALMLVDVGAVVYDLGGRERIADSSTATLLPPGVAHDGRAAPGSDGFQKRVAYLDATWAPEDLAGSLVDRPGRSDLLTATRRAHRALATAGEELAAETALLTLAESIIAGSKTAAPPAGSAVLASRLRDLIESEIVRGVTLAEAARLLGAHPGHLSRSFSSTYGLPPHRYLTSRRVDLARRLLLSGSRPAAVAIAAGFYDQAHFTRHFRQVMGTTPSSFATSATR
ncbi:MULTISPECIES: helix-turn-helix domain-containing protein [unclassified Rathayibacter]|uniref:helix-turn-helix domain-containing protein n=1 Tax=unclassified Rathayibacter TaxID=2609250 RepID=UPI00188C055B|nr:MULTISPECIES: AraC family transcriptional regulator [unclassified Rathayibacter]MBF4462501.1 AraC family transcriptional regulator [Rathayibacter sp. VKM Ac-2879]MBF4503456.1 AraC family transcriptional regulator [Rathayibacter sp. VKM Ac-2878]